MIKIDCDTYKLNNFNYYKTINKKTQIIISFSLRKKNYHIKRLQHKEFGKTKKWNTFTISRDGKIYQHYDSKYYTDFIGNKIADKQSISIVLENMGGLVNFNGNMVNWLNEKCDDRRVVNKKIFGFRYWEWIDDAQLQGAYDLCLKLCQEHKIPKQCIEFNQYHKDIINYNGIAFKKNYIEDSIDINALFSIEDFNNYLKNNK